MVTILVFLALFVGSAVITIVLYKNRSRLDDYYERKESELGKTKFFLLHGSIGYWRGNSWKFFAVLAGFCGLALLILIFGKQAT